MRKRWVALAVATLCVTGCGDAGDAVRGSGTIELDEVDVASLVGGRLVSLRAFEGDTVLAGDTLAVLERGEIPAALEAQVAQSERAQALLSDQRAGARDQELRAARADVAAATSSLELATSDFQRTQALAADKVVAQSDLDHARAARDAAQAKSDAAREQLALLEAGSRHGQLEAARAAAAAADADLQAARSRAHELVMVAPVTGVVLLRNANRGEIVGPGTPVMTLGDPSKLWIRVYVAAPKLPGVRLGASAEVYVNGVRRAYPGHVIEIASRAEFTPRAALTEEERSNVVFGVKVAIEPTAGALKPGLPADVRIRVPAAATPLSR
jgi:HlyD family secretion protein